MARADLIMTGQVAVGYAERLADLIAQRFPQSASIDGQTAGARTLVWPDRRRVHLSRGVVNAGTVGVNIGSSMPDTRHNAWAADVFSVIADALPDVRVELFDENDDVVTERSARSVA